MRPTVINSDVCRKRIHLMISLVSAEAQSEKFKVDSFSIASRSCCIIYSTEKVTRISFHSPNNKGIIREGCLTTTSDTSLGIGYSDKPDRKHCLSIHETGQFYG